MADKTPYCGHCGEEATQSCDDCTVLNYCSAECQMADQDWHKLLCKQFPDFIKPDTEEDVRRAILLPEDGEKPVFIWLKVAVEEDEQEEKAGSQAEVAEDLGVPMFDNESGSITPTKEGIPGFEGECFTLSPLVCGKTGGGEMLDHGLQLVIREDFTQCRPNKVLERLVGLDMASRFRGPVVFVRMTKVDISAFTLDIDSADFTLAVDGLVEYGKKQASPLTYTMQPKKVPGVRVNANIPCYEDVRILRTNSIFHPGGELSELSKKLDTSLSMTPLDTETGSAEVSCTLPAACLNICIHADSPAFGSIPFSTTTSALFVRPDMTAISTSEIIYLCDFIKDVAQPELLKASKASPKERQAAVDSVVEMWRVRAAAANADDSDEEVSSDDDESDDGRFDDLADVRAKMGQMQMTTKDARTGMGYI